MKRIITLVIMALLLSFSSCQNDPNKDDNPGPNPISNPNPGPAGSLSKIADHSVINKLRSGLITATAINDAKCMLHIGYGHTSHGSQLTDGMRGLIAFAGGQGCSGAYSGINGLFDFNRTAAEGVLHLLEGDGYGSGDLDHDCGYYPAWVDETRAFLGNPDEATGRGTDHPEFNVIIWSWCGQVSWKNEQQITSEYLGPMTRLEEDYPGISFVYMTGHLDGSGKGGDLHLRNEQIREYCLENDKWLFDFADIETYGPDGVDYGNFFPTDGCVYDYNNNGSSEKTGDTTPVNGDRNWAADWQDSHTQDVDWYSCGSQHSLPLNANMKAYAAWWLWCRLAGWEG